MEKISRLFESSSLPGFPILINCEQWIVKIVWILSIILQLGLSCWLINDLTENYYKNQEVISSQIVSEYHSQFIAVSFCTPIKKDIDFNKLDQFFSLNLSEPLINCTFDGLPCYWSDFFLDLTSLFQKTPYACYRFNAGLNATKYPIETKDVFSNDIDKGLVIHLNLSKFKQPLDHNTKFKIYIENASTLFIAAGKSDNGESITMPAGENIIKVTREIINRSESLNENCYNQKDRTKNKYRLVNVFNDINKTYIQSECLDLCAIEKFCNFSYSIQESFNSKVEEFINSKNFECVTKSSDDGAINFNNTIQNECKKECPLECETYIYKTSHSFLGHYFSENSSVTESRVQLSVYYPKLEYTLIKKFTRITFIDLVSQLGGVINLFFSVSLFSLVEILMIFLEVIVNHLKKKTSRRETFELKLNSVQANQNIPHENRSGKNLINSEMELVKYYN